MKKEDVLNDRLYKKLCNRKQLSSETQRVYVQVFTEYCTICGKTLTELRKEAYTEQTTIPDKLERKINDRLEKYQEVLEDRGLMNLTIKTKLQTVRAFYREYDIDLPKPYQFKRDKIIKKGSDIVTMEHIRKAVNSTPNFKYKAIITTLASSGMRSKDLRFLTIQDFVDATSEYHDHEDINDVIPALEGKRVIPCWEFDSKKTDTDTITFSSPESVEYTLNYLKQRKDLKNDYILFTSRNRGEYTVYSRNSLSEIFKSINDRLSFGQLPNSFHFFRAHKMRAFFGTTLNRNRVPYTVYKKMMGHRLNSVDGAYVEIDKATCKHEYLRCLKDLSTEKVKIKKVTSDEIKEIVTELDKQNKEISIMKEEKSKTEETIAFVTPLVDALKERPDLIEELMGDIKQKRNNK